MLTALEMRRKAVHIFVGIFTAVFYYFGIITWQFMLILAIIGGLLSWWLKKHYVPFLDRILDTFDRKQDKKNFPGKGALFYVIGVLLTMLLFDVLMGYKNIAIASIMILALGDSIAALLGPFGRLPHALNKVKMVEGTIAGIIAGYIGAVVFVSPVEAFFGSTIAMLVEALDLKFSNDKLDDNILVPVIAGFVMVIIRIVF